MLLLLGSMSIAALAAEPPVPLGSDAASAAPAPFGASATPLRRNSDVLPVDEAFAFNAIVEAGDSIVLMWEIREGYYHYQKSLGVELADGTGLAPALPEAEDKTDEFFGDVKVYHERLLLRVPLEAVQPDAAGNVALLVSYQGCAEERYCYPPAQKQLTLTLP